MGWRLETVDEGLQAVSNRLTMESKHLDSIERGLQMMMLKLELLIQQRASGTEGPRGVIGSVGEAVESSQVLKPKVIGKASLDRENRPPLGSQSDGEGGLPVLQTELSSVYEDDRSLKKEIKEQDALEKSSIKELTGKAIVDSDYWKPEIGDPWLDYEPGSEIRGIGWGIPIEAGKNYYHGEEQRKWKPKKWLKERWKRRRKRKKDFRLIPHRRHLKRRRKRKKDFRLISHRRHLKDFRSDLRTETNWIHSVTSLLIISYGPRIWAMRSSPIQICHGLTSMNRAGSDFGPHDNVVGGTRVNQGDGNPPGYIGIESRGGDYGGGRGSGDYHEEGGREHQVKGHNAGVRTLTSNFYHPSLPLYHPFPSHQRSLPHPSHDTTTTKVRILTSNLGFGLVLKMSDLGFLYWVGADWKHGSINGVADVEPPSRTNDFKGEKLSREEINFVGSIETKKLVFLSITGKTISKRLMYVERNFTWEGPPSQCPTKYVQFLEILNLYVKELPSMNYAANTGKKSTFLERCVSNGKYCTLVLKSKSEEGHGEVVAAISFQIIPADSQYAEVPLAAVSSVYQHKGIGHLTYLEMRKRLQSVGVHSIFCWADEESEGFWLKQGFVSVGQVDTKGRARRLPIRADIRKTLCFPGGSTLMIAHLGKECPDNPAESSRLSSILKPVQKSSTASMVQSQCPGAEKVLKNNYLMDGCQDLVCLDGVECIKTGSNEDEMRSRTDGDAGHCSCSSLGAKKRTWEASHTSLKSKKVKGGHLIVCKPDSACVSRSDKTNGCGMDVSPMSISRDKGVADFTPTLGGPLSNIHDDNALECRLGAKATNNHGHVELLSERNCYKIMLMNIADDAKKSNLTKIIKDLGGSVTSDGRVSTHVITGKVRKTLNFCTALCSGAWVISPAWLKESFREGRFVDEMPFIVKDSEYELKYRSDLKGTVLRARANPGALLKGFEVCLAAHVQPPINTLSAIVRSAGGDVIRNLEKVKDSSKTIFVASEDNMEEALSAIKKGIPTFSNEWFINCVMKQDLDLEAPQFAESL